MSEWNSLIEGLLTEQATAAKSERTSDMDPEARGLNARKITDEMPGGFFIYRANGDEELIYANKAVLRLFNCDTIEEFRALTGNSFRNMVHPDDLEAVEQSIREQIEHSQYDLDYVEYRIIQKGGRVRWVEDYGHFIRSQFAGDVFYVFIADATEKKLRIQEEHAALLLEKQQQELSLRSTIEAYARELSKINVEQAQRLDLIEGLSIDYESIFYVDLDANLIQSYRVSDRIDTQFSGERQIQPFTGFADQYAEEWVHPEDRSRFLDAVSPAFMRSALAGQDAVHVPYRIVKEGQVKHLLLCIVNVGDLQRSTQAVMGCRSMDEEIHRERERTRMLESALAKAKAASEVKNTFLSNMSHDIRTPMNAVIGYTALAKSSIDDREKLKSYLDMIEVSSANMLQLVDDVLEISRLEAGQVHLVDLPFDLHSLAQSIHDMIRPQAERKEIALHLDLSQLTHTAVYGDQDNLTQILMRLAGNAVKYTENGGRVDICFREPRHFPEYAAYQFIVEDTGIGISEEFLAHVFEPFERQKNTTLSGVLGTGLGLPIAKDIAEMMGGTIEVESTAGQGSRFTLSVSLRLQEPAARPAEASAAACAGPRLLLLVEDNEINREIETALLEEAGFIVDCAVNGREAVELVEKAPPETYSLILMDIQMPVLDGYGATRAIRALDNPQIANIPIVAVSANSFEEDRKLSMESGMNAHVPKPVDIGLLLDTINGLIGREERPALD